MGAPFHEKATPVAPRAGADARLQLSGSRGCSRQSVLLANHHCCTDCASSPRSARSLILRLPCVALTCIAMCLATWQNRPCRVELVRKLAREYATSVSARADPSFPVAPLTLRSPHPTAVSIVSLVIMIILFVTESITFLKVETFSDMFVDSAAPAAAASAEPHTMRVNIDILLPVYPCAVLSVDVQDQLGSHMLDVGGALHKYRVRPLSSSHSAAAASVSASRSRDRGGAHDASALDALRAAQVELVPDAHGGRHSASSASASSSATASASSEEAPTFAQAAAQRGEGCWVRGHIRVRLVPGNFHLSAHAHPDLLAALYGADRPHARMNISHVIRHLSFGEPPPSVSEVDDGNGATGESAAATRDFGRSGVGGGGGNGDDSVSALMALAPLDGTRQLAARHAKGTTSWEYYIKVVPTVVHRLGDADDAAPRRTFQFTANVNSVVGHFQVRQHTGCLVVVSSCDMLSKQAIYFDFCVSC
jgi:hypothetical protein